MRKAVFFALIAVMLPSYAVAKKTTYIVTNHRFNYVKLVELSAKDVSKLGGITQPKDIDEAKMRAVLKTVKMSRRHLFSKEIDSQEVFDDSSINYLAPALSKAFRDAKDNEKVVFSYLMKNPFFIIRNDRLNLGSAWIHDNELNIKFDKLYAKVTGNTDARGNEAKAVANSRGVRIDLEYGPGQQAGDKDPEVLIVDLNHDFETEAAAIASAEQTEKEEKANKKKSKKEVAKAEQTAPAASPAATPAQTATQGDDVKARLEKLEQLKNDKLITNKEYQEKKKEILKDL